MTAQSDDDPLVVRTARAILRLLAREAPADELARLRESALSAADGESEAKLIDEMVAVSGPVLSALERRRRREQESLALLETAMDLASVRDLDELLHTIVSRAKSMLRVDVAYLDLIDENSDDRYYHRITIGSVSTRFQGTQMPLGDGLGGLVGQTRTPVSTSDYFAEEHFRHTPALDDAVRDEGIVSLLGVPLLIGDVVTGVLYVAERSARVFTAGEVAFASSLGAHAAVAYENARLFDQMQSALAELNRANTIIYENSQSVALAAETHVKLTNLILRGGDLSDLAATLSASLRDVPLLIVDGRGDLLASSNSPHAGTVPEAVVGALERQDGSGRAYRHDGLYVAMAPPASDRAGGIVLESTEELSETDVLILERGAMVLALLLMIRQVVAETENRIHRDLVDDLISSGGQNATTLRERALVVGVDTDERHSVVVIDSDTDRDISHEVARWAKARNGLVGKHGGRFVFLLPDPDPGNAARATSAEVGSATGRKVTAGGAGPAVGPVEIGTAYSQALRCLEVLGRLGVVGEGASVSDLGVAGLLMASEPDSAQFVRSVLGPVIDVDDRRGTELLSTLDAYLESNRNLSRAARLASLHVNTFRQRLDRITQLLGEGWQDRPRMLEIEVALQLRRLTSDLRRHTG
ncbi:MAG: GAF domain-containing protein [Streptosporangiales bacterium]|nr:GAF domain-containing protein [Streptosporangiales bacterium]